MPVPTTRGSRNDRSRPYEQSEYSVSQSEDGGFSPMIGRFPESGKNGRYKIRDYVTADGTMRPKHLD
jgi:hypothetical protein